MTATGVHRPYWSKSLKRWLACQIVFGVPKSARFFSEEAAQKWFDAPLDHPHLPIRHQGKQMRRRPLPSGVSKTFVEEQP